MLLSPPFKRFVFGFAGSINTLAAGLRDGGSCASDGAGRELDAIAGVIAKKVQRLDRRLLAL
jgi:hypothetical protein